MGLFDSKSESFGGSAGKSDTSANSTQSNSAPVITINDTSSFQGSGKYVGDYSRKEINTTLYYQVTDHGAVADAFALAEESLEQNADMLADSLALVEKSTGQVLGLTEDVFTGAMAFTRATQAGALTAINDNLQQSLAFAKSASSPDGGLTVDIIKPLVYGAASVAMAYLAARAMT